MDAFTSIVRPILVRPVPRCVDHSHDDDAFTAGDRPQRVGNDVGKAGNGLLVGAMHPTGPPARHLPKGFAGVSNAIRDPSCSGRIVSRNERNLLFDVIQRFT